jgi:cell division septum initiation protein DivIVA
MAENDRLSRELNALKQYSVERNTELLDHNERLRKEVEVLAREVREVGALRTALSDGAEDNCRMKLQLQQAQQENAGLKKEIAVLRSKLAAAESTAAAAAHDVGPSFRIVSVHGHQKLSGDDVSGQDVLFAM